MSLRWQLARSHLAVIVLFLLLSLVCAVLIQPSPFPLHPKRRAAVESAVRRGEVFSAHQARRLGIPRDGRLWISDRNGLRQLYGQPSEPPSLPKLEGMDTAARRICAVNPNLSFSGMEDVAR